MVLSELVVSISGEMSKLSGVFTAASTEAGNFGTKMSSIGQTMSSAGSAMTAGVTVPLAAVGAGIGATMAKASEFDTGMRRVSTMLPGITKQGFDELSNQALDLSKTYESSTADMTNAMYQALSSGVPEDNVFTFMQKAEELAIGGATDVVTATDVLTTAVNSYGEANLSTAQASDILFQGTKFGKSTVEELAASLADVVPVAASLGIGFDDVNASLATMTIQGTPTAQATTQLRAIIDELGDSTSDVSAAFSEFTGQSFTEFIRGGGNVGEAVQILNEHLGETVPNMAKVTKAEKELNKPTSDMAIQFQKLSGKSFAEFAKSGGTVTQALDMMGVKYGTTANRVSEWFSRIEAGTGAQQLATDSGKLYTQSIEGMGTAAGATNEAFKTMSEGSGAALDRLKTSFEVLSIKMGQAFLPLLADTLVPAMGTLVTVIDKAVPILTIVAKAFGALPAPIQLGIIAFTAFVAALGPVLMIAGAIASGIGAISALFATGGALAGAGAVITGLIASLSALALPIVAVIAAIVLLYEAWTNNWLGIQEITADIVSELSADWEKISTELGRLPQVVSSSLSTLSGIFSRAFDGLISIASDVLQSVIGVVAEKMGAIRTYLASVNLSSVASTIWNTFLAGLTAVVLGPYNLIVVAITTIRNLLSGTNLSSYGQTVWNSFLAGIKAVIQGPYTTISTAINVIRSFLSGTNLSSIGSTVWNTFLTGIKTVLQGPYTAITGAITTIRNYLSSVTLNSIAQAIWNTFLFGLKAVISGPYIAIFAAIEAIRNLLSGTNFSSQGQTIWNTFLNGVRAVISGPYEAISGAITSIRNYLSGVNLYSSGAAIIQSLKDGVESKIQSVKDSINDLLSWIDSHMPHSPAKSGPLSRLPNFSSYITSPLTSAIKSAKTTATSAGSSIINSISTGIKKAASSVYNAASSAMKKVSNLLPHSPAKEGPFKTMPNWDAIFYTPLSQSIDRINTLSTPLTTALNSIKNPIDLDLSNGVKSISNVTSSVTNEYGGDTLSLGGVTLANNLDVNALFDAWEKRMANKRRARGI